MAVQTHGFFIGGYSVSEDRGLRDHTLFCYRGIIQDFAKLRLKALAIG